MNVAPLPRAEDGLSTTFSLQRVIQDKSEARQKNPQDRGNFSSAFFAFPPPPAEDGLSTTFFLVRNPGENVVTIEAAARPVKPKNTPVFSRRMNILLVSLLFFCPPVTANRGIEALNLNEDELSLKNEISHRRGILSLIV